MNASVTLPAALRALLAALTPRAGSLAVTIFGDSVAHQGNSVWLGGLVNVMQDFGLNARQTRTAIFRLGREGWLLPSLSGRRSYYSFTESGARQYARAAERIYAPTAAAWDGYWTLITSVGLEGGLRDELRRRLGLRPWQRILYPDHSQDQRRDNSCHPKDQETQPRPQRFG